MTEVSSSRSIDTAEEWSNSDPTVLIADDERQLTDAYATWLEEVCTTHTAYSGDEAASHLDETIDFALLDRQMPGRSGAELVSMIRTKGLECRAAVISANEPDLALIDVPYDLYLVKPVTEPETLLGVIGTLSRRAAYDGDTRRLVTLASKCSDMTAYVSSAELEACEAYADLLDELEELRSAVANADEVLESEGLTKCL